MEEIQDTMVIDNIAIIEDSTIQKRQYNTIILAGVCIAVLFHQVAGTYVIVRSLPPVFRLLTSDLLMWSTLPLLYYYAKKVEGRDFFLWKEKAQNLWFYVAAITVLYILTFCGGFIASIPRRLGYHDNYTVIKYWHAIIKNDKPLLFFTCLTAGFTEELQMRAYVLPRLSLLFKPGYWPVVISALIFSFLHLGYWNLSECIFTFVFGLICALFYKKYQNIQVLIILHFLYDLSAFWF
jgi:membrane protease YdiL (CAAX protease family)